MLFSLHFFKITTCRLLSNMKDHEDVHVQYMYLTNCTQTLVIKMKFLVGHGIKIEENSIQAQLQLTSLRFRPQTYMYTCILLN